MARYKKKDIELGEEFKKALEDIAISADKADSMTDEDVWDDDLDDFFSDILND